MFSSSTRFREISCPVEEECLAPNCLFKHTFGTKQHHVQAISVEDEAESAPPRKRQKVESKVEQAPPTPIAKPRPAKPFTGALLQKPAETKDKSNATTTGPTAAKIARQVISPPPAQRHVNKSLPPGKPESLNPRMLNAPPAGHATRLLYLKKLHEAMSALNDKLIKEGSEEQKRFQISPNQLILLALDEEERMARDSPTVYANVIKMSMVEHKRMTLDAWVTKRQKAMQSVTPEESAKVVSAGKQSLDTGLSPSQEVLVLPYLLAKQDGLEKFGYITSIPESKSVSEAQAAIAACDYWEKCERCDSRFQVFPDRREDGALTSGGTCTHHPLRAIMPPKDPATKGSASKIYPCCNEPLGTSQGCETASSHVFKFSDANRLASVMQFQSTPENHNVPADRAVSFDCEMGWTTKGMELIRITAVSWPTGDLLLDVLVKPLGSILDLNSRFSGVHPDQFASAPHYCDSAAEGPLQIVDSPQTARKLLFDLFSPSTPLIGHAIENDLNAVRIVHPCIIDTVLLFPIRSGLPFRRSLKGATKEFLGRSIQGGGAAGHDSKEDAKATGDLVRLKVKHKWSELKRQGWKAEKDTLVPPKTDGKYSGHAIAAQRIDEHHRRQVAMTGLTMDYGDGGD